ncbi:hypothetical protein GCM10010391_70970 [Streptomyces anthocyanicus]|nr:hypothetical protein GCM10010391_70970 [Streptomyces anthocyanicus]
MWYSSAAASRASWRLSEASLAVSACAAPDMANRPPATSAPTVTPTGRAAALRDLCKLMLLMKK